MAMNGGSGVKERQHVGRERHLGDVELAVPEHAKERLFHRQVEVVEIDALDLHPSVRQRARAVVVPARHGQTQLRHDASMP